MGKSVFPCILASLALVSSLSACGKKDDKDLAALDAQLTNNAADPALRAAVNDQISVDPDLVSQSNRNTVRPGDKPMTGAVPANLSGKASKADAERAAGGALMRTPAVTKTTQASGDDGVTLGALAERQKLGKHGNRTCGSPRVAYGNEWAQRLPAAFPIYPGAQLTDAAGTQAGTCNVRAVSFTTSAPVDDLMDFYTTMARKADYSVEHRVEGGNDVLGGVRIRDDGAYYISFTALRGGGTSVDLIANNGQ